MVVTQLPIAPLLLLVWREQERQEQHLPLSGCFLHAVLPTPPSGPPLLPVVGSEVGSQEHGGFLPPHARGRLEAVGAGGARERPGLIILPWSQQG